ncbi:MAG: right-handed parallel beta-helix repeat-containing protein [Lachnospiraceae bacterium]|nr:right-handed parallel beta-helix repeat-containing protein [Lachnospiraceae bacterium]
MSRKKNCMILTIVILAMLLAACGKKTGKEDGAEPKEGGEAQAETQEETQSENQGGTADGSTKTEQGPEDSMVGEWVYFCTLYHSEDSDGEYDYCTMLTDEDAPDSELIIRKDGEKYVADYKYIVYDSSQRIYGAELKYKEEAAYRGAENDKWCLELSDPFAGEEEDSQQKFSLRDDGILIASKEHPMDKSEDYPYYSLDVDMYMKKGSPELNSPEELRYFDTVTVSSAEELLNSVQNNRKIIVKEGKYNFSDIKAEKINNSFINQEYGAYGIKNVSNLCIEAETGADVLFCIDEAYNAVINFTAGRNIKLKGITAGHTVEPGYCSGSVLYYNDVNGVDIEDCHLYGSGTYGIEADYTYNINVTGTEIYECTYGLIEFRNTGAATFKNCVMRDSSEFSMININDGYEVIFENCEFKNNRSAYDSNYFVQLGEYDNVTFKKCSFSDNQFVTFSNREVTMEDCTYDNNYAGFSDLIKFSDSDKALDKNTILDNYKKVLKKQEEINKKLSSDSLMDQQSLNQTAYDEFVMWDTLLNQVWQYLENSLDGKVLENITAEQKKWIKEKESAMKDAGADFEGGTMQPMVEYGAGSTATRKRVEALIEKYL